MLKRRMPVMLEAQDISKWRAKHTPKEELEDLMTSREDCKLDAYRVNRDLVKIGNESQAYQKKLNVFLKLFKKLTVIEKI